MVVVTNKPPLITKYRVYLKHPRSGICCTRIIFMDTDKDTDENIRAEVKRTQPLGYELDRYEKIDKIEKKDLEATPKVYWTGNVATGTSLPMGFSSSVIEINSSIG